MPDIQQADVPIAELYTLIDDLNRKSDDIQRDIYIVAGVLGGVLLIALLAILILFYLTMQTKKKIREAAVQKQIEEQMNAQKFAAYTGEELHRKLLAVSNPAVPLTKTGTGQGPDSEYAFNAPFVDNRVLGAPTQNGRPNGNAAGSRFSRF